MSQAMGNAVASAARQSTPWVQRLARAGYLAKGLVYLVVGGIALRAALGTGVAEGSRGALRTMLGAPFGQVLLGFVAIGLFGYSLWRAYCAVADPERDGGWHRVYCAIVAVLHIGIAVEAARLALHASGGGGDGGARHWTAEVLTQPLGKWIIVGVAVAVMITGLGQLVKAWKSKLDDQLQLHTLSAPRRALVRSVARIGIAARAVVFVVVGLFLLRAGLQTDASHVRDPGGALRALEQQPFGAWLLGFVAAGLIAYGIYELVRARYRVIRLDGGGAPLHVERG